MFIHFAFGTLGKQGKLQKQTEAIIQHILKDKRLKVSKCKEFIPAYPEPGSKRIPHDMFKATDDGAAATFYPQKDPKWLENLPDDTTIHYLPVDVPMICFMKIPFKQLNNSTHSNEYGGFGIVLTDSFLKANRIRRVHYYTEESLWNDPLIRKWNFVAKSLNKGERPELEKEILSFRKPASLFPSFKESVIMKITRAPDGTRIEHLTYDRYKERYDFRKESEYRIIFDEGVDYLDFEEKDLFMVITPDTEVQRRIQDFFSQYWREKPQVRVYPS